MNDPTRAPTVEDYSPLPVAEEPQQVRLISALLVALWIGLFLALPFVLQAGSIIFLPFVAAIVLSIVLSPLADRLAAWGVPNVVASFLALALALALLVLTIALILQPALDLFDRVPAMFSKISSEVSQMRSNFDWLNDLNRQLGRMTGNTAAREVVVVAPSVIEQVAFATPSLVLEVLLTLLVTFFMIEARMRMRRHLLLDRVTFGASLKAARTIRDVQDRVASYILTVALINFCMGAIVAAGAWALGMEAPIMWGGLAAVLNFLPYIGPLTMVAVLALFSLGTTDNLLVGLVPPAAFLALHTIEANVVTPSILGARFTMNPVLILFSISYFSWIWGITGALLSIPILITLTALFEHIGTPNFVGFIFGEPLFAMPEVPSEP